MGVATKLSLRDGRGNGLGARFIFQLPVVVFAHPKRDHEEDGTVFHNQRGNTVVEFIKP